MSNEWVSAGLVFRGVKDLSIATIKTCVDKTLQSLDHKVVSARTLSDRHAMVFSRYHRISLQILNSDDKVFPPIDVPAKRFLSIQITRKRNASGTPKNDPVMLGILTSLQDLLSADYVQKFGQPALLSREDFARATGSQTSNLAPDFSSAAALQGEQDTHNKLRAVFRDHVAENAAVPVDVAGLSDESAPLRLSTWMVSFAVALFALPVGIALIVCNLLMGENLRLTSQTAALTGMFISLNTYGTTEQAMMAIMSFVG